MRVGRCETAGVGKGRSHHTDQYTHGSQSPSVGDHGGKENIHRY